MKRCVHKYRNDDPKTKFTACGLGTQFRGNILCVTEDARKATCGNCQRATTKVKKK